MTNYHDYLQLDHILGSQHPVAQGEHDEMLCIVIHQAYELWFKQILHEANKLNQTLSEGDISEAISTVSRVLVILKTVVKQTDILETMSPISFASFRRHLDQASGLQSLQFRLIEFWLGFKNPRWLQRYEPNTREHALLKNALHTPSLYDYFLRYLDQVYPGRVPDSILTRDVSEPYAGCSEVVDLVFEFYMNRGLLHVFCEKLVDLDEGFQEWRYRHVKMVERTIGAKPGTGGSAGVEYLRGSLFHPAFADLWQVRNRL